jgi:hypothetical protein
MCCVIKKKSKKVLWRKDFSLSEPHSNAIYFGPTQTGISVAKSATSALRNKKDFG